MDLFCRVLDTAILDSVLSGMESDFVPQGQYHGHLLSGTLGAATQVSHGLHSRWIFQNREAAVFAYLHLAILLWTLHSDSGTDPSLAVDSGFPLPVFE